MRFALQLYLVFIRIKSKTKKYVKISYQEKKNTKIQAKNIKINGIRLWNV